MKFSIKFSVVFLSAFALLLFLATQLVAAQSTIPNTSAADINNDNCQPNDDILGQNLVVRMAEDKYLQAVSQLKGPGSRHGSVNCSSVAPTDFLIGDWERSEISLSDIAVMCLNDKGIMTSENVFLTTRVHPLNFTISLKGIIAQHGTCYLFYANPEVGNADVTMDTELIPPSEVAPGGIDG